MLDFTNCKIAIWLFNDRLHILYIIYTIVTSLQEIVGHFGKWYHSFICLLNIRLA